MSELEFSLKEKREELNRLIGARDFNSVVALHTSDVKFMAPHMDLVDGRINLYQMYSKAPADGKPSVNAKYGNVKYRLP